MFNLSKKNVALMGMDKKINIKYDRRPDSNFHFCYNLAENIETEKK